MDNVNFGYCLWLLCDKDEELEKIADGFEAHMSILTDLNLTEAFDLYECLEKNPSLVVEVDQYKSISYDNGFNTIYFKVKYDEDNERKKPNWWPDNAHISVKYKYNEDFTDGEKRIKIFDKKCKMKGIKLMRCTGHHKDWRWIM
tara:strand:- start:123 stop:554 length:432 start_codon:yes stop_codon:yes gene_type:complete